MNDTYGNYAFNDTMGSRSPKRRKICKNMKSAQGYKKITFKTFGGNTMNKFIGKGPGDFGSQTFGPKSRLMFKTGHNRGSSQMTMGNEAITTI